MKPCLLALLAASVFLPAIHADEPAIVAKARAYLGSEAALTGVRTLHYTGTFAQSIPGNPKGNGAAVQIFFEKPWRERIQVTYPDHVIETALDDYDAWQRTTQAASPASPSLTLIGTDVIRSLRADTWENLYFYRGIGAGGGSVEDLGPATVDGIACEKVAFHHPTAIVYFRYFDLATGRAVYTETAAGVKIREEGEMVVAGIRFPKRIVTVEKSAAGAEVTTTYNLDTVAVNEALPDSLFTVPFQKLTSP